MGRHPSTPLPLSWTELFDAQPLSVRLLLLLNSTLLLLLLLRPWILLLRLIPRKRRRPAKRAPHAPVAIALSRRSEPPKPIRKDGEWPRVEPSELDPALCKAWQQLCAAAAAATAPEDATPEDAAIYGPVQPIEEYDTLRALKARRLNLPRTLEWLHGHRRWWRENQPRQKRFCMQGDPGVQVCLGSGMARWFALDKRGTPYFYTDLQCWAPHLVSCADHTNFAITGLELMREAGRQFCPGAPEHLNTHGCRCLHVASCRLQCIRLQPLASACSLQPPSLRRLCTRPIRGHFTYRLTGWLRARRARVRGAHRHPALGHVARELPLLHPRLPTHVPRALPAVRTAPSSRANPPSPTPTPTVSRALSRCVHKIYLLNAPPIFANAWKVIR